MSGWKTWTGGIGGILSGMAIMVKCMSTGDYHDLGMGLAMVFGGFSAIGIGHKIQRVGEKIEQQ